MSLFKNIDICFDDINIGKIIETIYEFIFEKDKNKTKSKNDKELENEKNNNGDLYIEDKKSIKEVNEIKDRKEKEDAGNIKEFSNYEDIENDKETKNNLDNKDSIKEVKIAENAPIQVCFHKILGIVSYITLNNEIKISFSNKNTPFFILKHPILFVEKENNEEGITVIYTKSDLNKALNLFDKSHEFIVNSKIIKDKTLILNDLPTKIILRRRKKENELTFEIFESLNHKKEISNKDYISIEINELIPQDILSLGIYRDNMINIVLKNRNELIKEIINFMGNGKERIMKIFGVDGIGKSLTCIYLTSLMNNFRTIYFNLKEFFENSDNNIVKLFKSQLTNYYANGINKNSELNSSNDKEIYKDRFSMYEESMKDLDKDIETKNIRDFWGLLDNILEKFGGNIRNNLLIIIDQYKSKFDNNQKLFALEKKIIQKTKMFNIKILEISSLNDMGIKDDFIEVLVQCSKKLFKESVQIIEEDNIEDDALNKEENIFKEFSDNINYLETGEKENNDFEKIKIFNEIKDEDEKKDNKKVNLRTKINEYIILDKIEKKYSSYLNSNKYIDSIDDNYRIIYINDLVSIESIGCLEEEQFKQIITNLSNFNYNPKYYNQIKDNIEKNKIIKDADEIYNDFIIEIYNKISSKIKGFYKDFNKKNGNILTDSHTAVILLQLIKLVEEKIELDLNSLIFYLNKFPIKYLKIIAINKGKNNSFLKLDKEISTSKFRIEYAFPFIKLIISRILFELGESKAIHYSDISGSGIGSFLEKIIRKTILLDKIYGDFHSRYVWALKRFITPRKGKNKSKKEEDNQEEGHQEEDNQEEDNQEEEEVKSKEKKSNLIRDKKIDFFNLKEIKYDDEIENPLTDYSTPYYIIPDNQTNPILDSIILIPCKLANSDKSFNSLSLQITIKKKKIYSLKEYHDASSTASSLTEKIYDIKIKNKYFLFVLEKDYDNTTTINILVEKNIPFVFFSSNEKYFYFNNGNKIPHINAILDDKFLIGNEEVRAQSFFNKEIIYHQMENLLRKKRNRDQKKITKNLFSFIRKKLYKNEKPLILTKDIYQKVIDLIKTNSFYKNKKILIEFIFQIPFSECMEFLKNKNNNLLGLVFYRNQIALLNSKFKNRIEILKISGNSNKNYLDEICKFMVTAPNDDKLDKTNSNPILENLIKFNTCKPSNLFVFLIYEINDK